MSPHAVRYPGLTGTPLRGRFYYGWLIVSVLALTVTTSYGVLMYAFPVVLRAMQNELGWSQQMLTGAYSLGAFVGGLMAIPVGRWLDRHGSRLIMTTSALAASLLVGAWAFVEHPAVFYLIWIGLGACSAGLFYEPAFTTIAQWFFTFRRRALTIVTVAGALASTLFVPLTAGLLQQFGWRGAVLLLAVLLATLTVIPHALVLRRRPADLGLQIDGSTRRHGKHHARRYPALRATAPFQQKSLQRVTAVFFISTLANTAFAVHLVPLLLERGHPIAFASGVFASIGVMKVLGRVLLAPLSRWLSITTLTIVVLGLQALGLFVLVFANAPAAVWTCVLLFGIGDGASTPARAELVAEYHGSTHYGLVLGKMALFLAAARAAGPVGLSLLFVTTGGYTMPLLVLTLLLLVACWMLGSGGRSASAA